MSIPILENPSFPIVELHHNNEKVVFAIRSMEETNRNGKQQDIKLHSHSFYTIFWFLDGSGTHRINSSEITIVPNSIWFLPPNTPHQLLASENTKGYVIFFTDEFLNANSISKEYIEELEVFNCIQHDKILYPDYNFSNRLEGYIIQMIAEFKAINTLKNDGLSAWLKLFLVDSKRLLELQRGRPVSETKLQPIVRDFHILVDRNYKIEHKVQFYADQLNITPNYLSEVLKSNIGRSPKEIIQQKIFVEAKNLAHNSDLSLKQVADELGFEDSSHFSKFFKALAGVNFTEVKEKNRKNYI